MACLKCGKETEENQVFCQACQQVMANYPVKPGTLVQLPHRATVPEKKPPRKRKPSAEDTVVQLRGIVRWLTATVGILAILVCLLAGILLQTLFGETGGSAIGRNYTTADTPRDDS